MPCSLALQSPVRAKPPFFSPAARRSGLPAEAPGRTTRAPSCRGGRPPTEGLAMTTTQAATTPPAYDNNGQYTRTGILRYERIFGDGYVSTGGPETTEDLCARLGTALRPGARVLDVGSGIGGAAFHLASTYGAVVTGIDLSPEMINIAQERAARPD